MLNIGILGSGRIGQVHGATLRGMTTERAAAVSDFLPEAAEALAEKLGAKAMSTDAIIADPDIDAVVRRAWKNIYDGVADTTGNAVDFFMNKFAKCFLKVAPFVVEPLAGIESSNLSPKPSNRWEL